MGGVFSEEGFLRLIVEDAVEPLRLERDVFKSVDHVVRCFDSALFKLYDMNVLDERSVRLLLEVLGLDFAPYIVLISKYADFIRSQKPRFSLINNYLHVIEEFAEMYKGMGVEAPDLPLGFNRPPPDRLEPKYGFRVGDLRDFREGYRWRRTFKAGEDYSADSLDDKGDKSFLKKVVAPIAAGVSVVLLVLWLLFH